MPVLFYDPLAKSGQSAALLNENGHTVTSCLHRAAASEQLNTKVPWEAIILHDDQSNLLDELLNNPSWGYRPIIICSDKPEQLQRCQRPYNSHVYYLDRLANARVYTDLIAYHTLARDEQARKTSIKLSFKTTDQAHDTAQQLARHCGTGTMTFLGLSELLLNAVEHGNLNLGFDEKAELIRNGKWHSELQNRLQNPLFKNRIAEANITQGSNFTMVTIRDQGTGFPWWLYQTMPEERQNLPHGRGIALARTLSFQQLIYQGSGNVVMGLIQH